MPWRRLWLLATLWFAVVAGQAQTGPVIVLKLQDTLQPVSEAYVHRELTKAARRQASLVILSIQSPGGLASVTQRIATDLRTSPVPVAVMSDSGEPAAVLAAASVRSNVIDPVALLRRLDGQTVLQAGSEARVLHLQGAKIETVARPARERFLSLLARPNIAVVLLTLGVLLVYAECNVPGTVVPGCVGTLLLLFSAFGLWQLPVRGWAVFEIAAGLAISLLELRWRSRLILPLLGNLLLIHGLLRLVNGPIAELRVHPTTAIACGIVLGTVTLWLASIALRARRNKTVGSGAGPGGSIAFADTGSAAPEWPTG